MSLAGSEAYLGMGIGESMSEPSGTIRIEKLKRTNSVQRALNYLIGPDGIVIETATRIL